MRLICRLKNPKAPDSIYLTLTTGFHFNSYTEDGDDQISAYSHTGNTISFFAGKATATGFNKISTLSQSLGAPELRVIETLKSFTSGGQRRQIRLHLQPSEGVVQLLDQIKARLPGGDQPLLPSIGLRDFEMFGGKGQSIACYNGSMLRPHQVMGSTVPLPMVALTAESTFSSLRDAAVQLAYSATISNDEARVSMQLWAAVAHDARLFLDHDFPVLAIYFRNFDKLGGRNRGPDEDVHFRLPHDLACDFKPFNMYVLALA